jgi:hypothetical protein
MTTQQHRPLAEIDADIAKMDQKGQAMQAEADALRARRLTIRASLDKLLAERDAAVRASEPKV